MNKRKLISLVFAPVIASLLAAAPATAQKQPDTVSSISGIEIKTSVDKAEMYVGDLINYTITITYDSSIELLPPPLGANLGAFDVKDYQTDMTTRLPDGKIRSENRFVLSTFTTGDYIIPPVPMAFEFPDGSHKIVLSESVPIKVNSLLFNVDDSADIKPLKAQYEFKRDYTSYYFWGALAVVLLAVAGFFIWRKLKRREEGELIDLRPAWEIAFEKLALLEQKGLLNEEQFKEYYLKLTEIFRCFLGRMYAANIPDMTTEEFLAKYDEIGLAQDDKESLKEFLEHADLVKFARFVPEKDRAESDFTLVHDNVEKVRLEFQRQAEEQARAAQVVSQQSSSETVEKSSA